MAKDHIQLLIEQASKKIDVPNKFRDKVNTETTLEKSKDLITGIFNAQLYQFIDTIDDERYFLRELQKHLIGVFPRKKRRSNEFKSDKRKAFAEKYAVGGVWYWKKNEFKDNIASNTRKLAEYRKKYPGIPTNAEESKAYHAKSATKAKKSEDG